METSVVSAFTLNLPSSAVSSNYSGTKNGSIPIAAVRFTIASFRLRSRRPTAATNGQPLEASTPTRALRSATNYLANSIWDQARDQFLLKLCRQEKWTAQPRANALLGWCATTISASDVNATIWKFIDAG